MAKPIFKINKNDSAETIVKKTQMNGTIRMDNKTFEYELFLLPILGNIDTIDKPTIETMLVTRLGNRFQKDGKRCLDMDEDLVRENINNNEYSVIGFVKNITDIDSKDVASGTMQYYNWCDKNGGKQLWIGDLCRITEGDIKPSVSPVKALLHVFEMVTVASLGKKIKYLHLMVEDEPEKVILPKIYKKYGFDIVGPDDCSMSEYIVMKKKID